MFEIGDKVLYPMHGVGIVEGIEKKEILGELKDYYTLRMIIGEMKIMVPVESCEEIGIRHIVKPETISEVLKCLAGPSDKMPSNWNKRCRENTDKLKTGDIFQVAGVVRNLIRQDREKKLSMGEKRLLTSAIHILAGEMMIVLGNTIEQAEKMIEEAV